MTKLSNWAGNLRYSTDQIYFPKNNSELGDLIRRHKHLRMLGTRHSFNTIGDSEHAIISTEQMGHVIEVDPDNNSVKVGAGVRYGDLCKVLAVRELALHNLGSLPHISVVGACVSATHGSGRKNGALCTAVSALDIITANGEEVSFSKQRDPEMFYGAVVNLGALGAVTSLTLDLQPSFDLQQEVFENLSMESLCNNFDEVFSAGYSVSLFTDWKTEYFNQLWIKRKMEGGEGASKPLSSLFGAFPAVKNLHPIAEMPAENCTQQMGVRGLWYERLPHFRMEFTPSRGDELQSEYFVPIQYGREAVQAVNKIKGGLAPYVLISELRTIAADKFWMSPFYQQDCLAFHFTWKPDWKGVKRILPEIEQTLSPYDCRPHWGKLFTLDPREIQIRYPRLKDFRDLVQQYDPTQKFRNTFVNQYVFA